MFMHRSDVCSKTDLLRGRGTDHFRKPPQVGRAPIGPAGVTAIVSKQQGLEPAFSVFEITEGIFTSSGEVANGFILDLGDIDRSAIF